MKIKQIIILILIISIAVSTTAVQRNSHFDLTTWGIGTRSISMGGAFTALKTPETAVFTNPASLVDGSHIQVHSALFNVVGDFSTKAISAVIPFPQLQLGIGVISNLTDGFTKTSYDGAVRDEGSFSAGDTVIILGLGRTIYLFGQTLHAGINAKYLLQSISTRQRIGVGADAGIRNTHLNNRDFLWESGLVIKNIWAPTLQSDSYFSDSEIQQSQIMFGTSLSWKTQGWQALADFQGNKIHAGLEYNLNKNLSVRAGSSDGDLTMGLGFILSHLPDFDGRNHIVELQYAYKRLSGILEQDSTHFFGISYLGPTPDPIKIQTISTPKRTKQESITRKDSQVALALPKDKMYTDKDYIWAKGRAKNNINRLFINGIEATLSPADNSFQKVIPLTKFGKNLISIEALDINGNQVKISRRIFRKATFVDLLTDDESADAIKWMAELGYFSGYNDGSFHPEKQLSRAELASLLSKIKKLELSHQTRPVFQDVPVKHWAAPYIESVAEAKIMPGYSDNTYRPQNPISHSEAVIIISMFDDLIAPKQVVIRSFNDLPVDDPAAPWAEAAKTAGILKGLTLIKPSSPLTRGDAALWLSRTKTVQPHLAKLADWDIGYTN